MPASITGERREPAEMCGCFVLCLRDDRHVQAAADHRGDLPERDSFLGDRMERATG